jgi:YHS domain-containing protein/DNA-binding transcriptional ArsR family regulator
MYSQVFKLHAQLLKAIAHPKRLEIIHLLRNQALTVSQICSMLNLPQANISQHLMLMRDAGIVTPSKNGKEVSYKLAHANVIKASDLMRELLIKKYQNDPLANELALNMSDLVPLAIDPICGMRLSPKTAGYAFQHKGKTYYFCASGCLKQFKQQMTHK